MLRNLLDLIAPERRLELLRSDVHIRTIAQPGFDLIPQPALLQLIDKALHTSHICLGKSRRNERGRFRGNDRPNETFKAAHLIEKPHVNLRYDDVLLPPPFKIQGCFSFFAARIPDAIASFSHMYAPLFVLP
jgi:hypothetical protein